MMILTKNKDNKISKLTAIQIGESKYFSDRIEEYKNKCQKKGVDFEWYFYPGDMSTEELKQEVIDLLPFVDRLVFFPIYIRHINMSEIADLIADYWCETATVLD